MIITGSPFMPFIVSEQILKNLQTEEGFRVVVRGIGEVTLFRNMMNAG